MNTNMPFINCNMKIKDSEHVEKKKKKNCSRLATNLDSLAGLQALEEQGKNGAHKGLHHFHWEALDKRVQQIEAFMIVQLLVGRKEEKIKRKKK